MITVQEIIEAPQLRLSLLAGTAGLDTPVQWAHTCDLPEPWNWVGEHQVMLTNGTPISPDAQSQIYLLEKLVEAGVASLGVGAEMGAPEISDAALRRADELSFPIFSIPYPLPFIAVAQLISEATSAEQSRRVQATARLYNLINSKSFTRDEQLAALFDDMSEIIGFEVAVVDAACLDPWVRKKPIRWLKDATPLSKGSSDPIASLWINKDREVLHALPVQADANCLAFFRPYNRHDSDTSLLLHASSVLSVAIGQHLMTTVQQNRRDVEFVDRIINQSDTFSNASPYWLAELGYTTETRGVVIAGATAEEREAYIQRLSRHGLDIVSSIRSGKLLAILNPDPGMTGKDLHGLLHHCLQGDIIVGLGRQLPPSEIRASLREALWAAEMANIQEQPEHDMTESEPSCATISTYQKNENWLGFTTPEQGLVFIESVLGPLLKHTETNRELFDTLSTYLRQDRSPQKTSEALHLHRQTINKRLKRIESLLDVDLRDTKAVAELWIATKLYQATGIRELG